jgi:hypothetical protein
MAVADRNGLLIAVAIADGSRGEAGLIEETLEGRFTKRSPKRLIGDKAYDSTKLEAAREAKRIELSLLILRT